MEIHYATFIRHCGYGLQYCEGNDCICWRNYKALSLVSMGYKPTGYFSYLTIDHVKEAEQDTKDFLNNIKK